MRAPSIAAARPAGSAPEVAAKPADAVRGPAAWKLDPIHPSRRDALRLHRFLTRQARRLSTVQADLEDAVLLLIEQDAPRALGLPSIEAFAAQVLALPRRTVYDYLHRARRRRRDDPVATALAGGRIGDVHADLLERLARSAGVPRSALPPWIEAATHLTVRGLRDRVRWARLQTATDYRAWSLAGFPVPDRRAGAYICAAARPLSARRHATRSGGHPAAKHLPQVRLDADARTSTLVVLLQLMASLQDAVVRRYERDTATPAPDRRRGGPCCRCASWLDASGRSTRPTTITRRTESSIATPIAVPRRAAPAGAASRATTSTTKGTWGPTT